jgi:beta-1,4-mannooligosaccharide phosphorylase
MLYHGVRRTPSGCCIGWDWLSSTLRDRKSVYYEGIRGSLAQRLTTSAAATSMNVVFPCGYTMNADGDTNNLYYGAADCSIALARASVRSLLAWLDANGSCERRQRSQDL